MPLEVGEGQAVGGQKRPGGLGGGSRADGCRPQGPPNRAVGLADDGVEEQHARGEPGAGGETGGRQRALGEIGQDAGADRGEDAKQQHDGAAYPEQRLATARLGVLGHVNSVMCGRISPRWGVWSWML